VIAARPDAVGRTSRDRRCAGLSTSSTSPAAAASFTVRCTNCRLSDWARPICGTVIGPSRTSMSSTARTPTSIGVSRSTLRSTRR
jgi:hypothetical protein